MNTSNSNSRDYTLDAREADGVRPVDLIAAVTGGLLVATIGVARLTQLRVRAHRTRAVPR